MKTKVDERREREEYERKHPWLSLAMAIINDGVVCELLFSSMTGQVDGGKMRFFLGEDDRWYQIDPPGRPMLTPMNWRPTNGKLTLGRRAEIITNANKRGW